MTTAKQQKQVFCLFKQEICEQIFEPFLEKHNAAFQQQNSNSQIHSVGENKKHFSCFYKPPTMDVRKRLVVAAKSEVQTDCV